MLNDKQVEALADAQANSGHGLTGLVRQSGSTWAAERRGTDSSSHSHNTIRSLVDRGYLKLWVEGTIAHITDSGSEALEDWREDHLAGATT